MAFERRLFLLAVILLHSMNYTNAMKDKKYIQEISTGKEIVGDGNCFYRCLSVYLHGHQNEHSEIRENIILYMSGRSCESEVENEERSRRYGRLMHNTRQSYEDYLRLHNNSGEWADEPIIQAAADLYGFNIYVSSYGNSGVTQRVRATSEQLRHDSGRLLHLRLQNSHYTCIEHVRYRGSSNNPETSHGNEKPFISLRSAKDPVDQNIGSGTGQDSISKPSTPETKEDFCVKELLDTEEKYVDTLRMIHLQFNEGLRDVVLQADRDVIFSHIEKLLIIHQKFQAELQSPFTSGIGEVFVKYKKSFLLYGNYCSDLQKAQERLKEITRRNKNVRTGIENCEQQSNPGKFKLRDLLYVPMQRVLKYHLLLSELFKHSEKEAKDKDSLKQGLEAMKDLSLYINEVKRDSETLQKIDKLQSSIRDLQMPANTTLKDYGRLQKEGELNVRSHTNNKIRSRYIFLFDKVMLICKAKRVGAPFKGESYFRFKETITLTEYNVQEMQPANRDTKHRGDKVLKWNSSFIMRKKGNQIHALSFFAKTENMNAEWIGAVNLALENASPPQGINYVMHTFDQPTECSVCGKLLRGIFFQGYKCTDPGSDIAVHKECIGKQPDTGSRGNPNAGGGRPALHFQKDEENKSKKVFAGPTKEDIIRSIKAVKSETLDDFRSSAKELIAELQAEDALAAALALISGSTKITSHSMLSSKEELVELCGENSMADSFPGVDTTPKSHFKTQSGGSANTLILGYAEAVYDYAATATSQLSLCRGDKVAILSKKESEKGWWKGENCDSGKNGYFPLKYVSELC